MRGRQGAPFAELWNGAAWTLANTGVSTGLNTGSRLSSVSCVGLHGARRWAWPGHPDHQPDRDLERHAVDRRDERPQHLGHGGAGAHGRGLLQQDDV